MAAVAVRSIESSRTLLENDKNTVVKTCRICIEVTQSPPYAIPYGWWIPNPIYGYRYWVGIMRLIRMVVDMRSEIGESGSEKKLCTLLKSKSQNDPINIFHAPKSPRAHFSGPSRHRPNIGYIGPSDPWPLFGRDSQYLSRADQGTPMACPRSSACDLVHMTALIIIN